MDLRDYLRLLRNRWRLIGACALLAIAAAAAFAALTTKTYQAHVRLFVSTQDSAAGTAQSLQQGALFSQARVKSYADIVSTAPVTQPVVDQLGLRVTADQLGKKVKASAPLDTVLIDVTVSDASAVQAQAIANAVGTQFTRVVDDLERPVGGGPSPVKVSVVQQATLPTAPVSPKRNLDLALGLIVGLAVGVGFAVLGETLDTSVKSPQEVQDLAGAAALGIIAFDPDAERRPLIVEVSPHSPRSEAFRQLRTNLQFVDAGNPLRSVVVTSALPREGKSTTTCNLAITLARAGVKVLLVEGDLRRPRIGRYLGLPDSADGLTDVLIGRKTLDEAVTRYGEDGPYLLPAGPKPPNPAELLGGEPMRALMRELVTRFDLVLIDAPPLLPVTDAAILSTITSGVLFITRAGKTNREQVSRAIDSLKAVDGRVLGVVLNMVNPRGPQGYAYGYGYGAYGYGYAYSDEQPKRGLFRRRKPVPIPPPPASVAPVPVAAPPDGVPPEVREPVPVGAPPPAEETAEEQEVRRARHRAPLPEEGDDAGQPGTPAAAATTAVQRLGAGIERRRSPRTGRARAPVHPLPGLEVTVEYPPDEGDAAPQGGNGRPEPRAKRRGEPRADRG